MLGSGSLIEDLPDRLESRRTRGGNNRCSETAGTPVLAGSTILLVGAGLEVLEDLDWLVGEAVVDRLREVALAFQRGPPCGRNNCLRYTGARARSWRRKRSCCVRCTVWELGDRTADVYAARASSAPRPFLVYLSHGAGNSGRHSGLKENIVPWYWLVPDLVVMLTTAPPPLRYSAAIGILHHRHLRDRVPYSRPGRWRP